MLEIGLYSSQRIESLSSDRNGCMALTGLSLDFEAAHNSSVPEDQTCFLLNTDDPRTLLGTRSY